MRVAAGGGINRPGGSEPGVVTDRAYRVLPHRNMCVVRSHAMKLPACLTLGALALLLGGCGGDGGGGSGTCTPSSSVQITITASGVSPTLVCVLPDGAVTFRNDDTVEHDIQSGAGCPALNLGPIPASTSKVATFVDPQTCPFHDEKAPTNMAFQGTVAVSAAPTEVPGY